MTERICIVCPNGCRLRIDEDDDYAVYGNGCERGVAYAKAELLHPVRVLTSTVRLQHGAHPRCPVKTDGAVPKERLFDIMRELDGVDLAAPVSLGQVIIPNVCGTGVNIVATRNLQAVD